MQENIRIIMLLDESGSMTTNKQETILAVNTFISSQQELKVQNECRFSLFTFNSKTSLLFDDVPLHDVTPITNEHYKPNSQTALYDAMGEVFTKFKDNTKVVFVIITDGFENSSREFNSQRIKELVEKYKNQDTFSWQIVYLAADPLLVVEGTKIGIDQTPGSSNISVDFRNLSQHVDRRISRAVSCYRENSAVPLDLSKMDLN